MRRYNVRMTAFGRPNEVRVVDIPDDVEPNLDNIFYYGQNDFQAKPHPSVSVGDIIEFDGDNHLVKSVGFEKLSTFDLMSYLAMDRDDRWMRARS